MIVFSIQSKCMPTSRKVFMSLSQFALVYVSKAANNSRTLFAGLCNLFTNKNIFNSVLESGMVEHFSNFFWGEGDWLMT